MRIFLQFVQKDKIFLRIDRENKIFLHTGLDYKILHPGDQDYKIELHTQIYSSLKIVIEKFIRQIVNYAASTEENN